MILLIQSFKAFNNTLGWKDPDSREGESRNIVARAQPPLHIIGQAENKKTKLSMKFLKAQSPSKYLL